MENEKGKMKKGGSKDMGSLVSGKTVDVEYGLLREWNYRSGKDFADDEPYGFLKKLIGRQ